MTVEASNDDGQVFAIADLAMALLEEIGRLDFQERIMNTLKQQVAFDASLILFYRRECPPKVLFNDWRTDRGLSNIQQYLQGYYRLDPFYRLTLEDGIDGVHRLNQLDTSFGDSDYYREFYRYSGLPRRGHQVRHLARRTQHASGLYRRRAGIPANGDAHAGEGDRAPLPRPSPRWAERRAAPAKCAGTARYAILAAAC